MCAALCSPSMNSFTEKPRLFPFRTDRQTDNKNLNVLIDVKIMYVTNYIVFACCLIMFRIIIYGN